MIRYYRNCQGHYFKVTNDGYIFMLRDNRYWCSWYNRAPARKERLHIIHKVYKWTKVPDLDMKAVLMLAELKK